MSLNEKRGVPDPGDTNLAFTNFGELWRRMIAGAFDEKRRDQDAGEKITLVPVGMRTQPHARGTFSGSTIPRRLSNDIPLALFRKTNRHLPKSI